MAPNLFVSSVPKWAQRFPFWSELPHDCSREVEGALWQRPFVLTCFCVLLASHLCVPFFVAAFCLNLFLNYLPFFYFCCLGFLTNVPDDQKKKMYFFHLDCLLEWKVVKVVQLKDLVSFFFFFLFCSFS